MTHQLYTEQVLAGLTIQQLKQIAAELGVTPEGDKRKFETWASAILSHQYHQLEFQLSKAETVDVSSYDQPANLPQVGEFQSLIGSQSQPQSVVDYKTIREQKNDLPQVGDIHFIGSFMLRCAVVGGDYAVVWECSLGNAPMGDIAMDWDCFWSHTMSLDTFATPQEAIADLYVSLETYEQEYKSEHDVTFTDTDGYYNFQARVNGRTIAELPCDPFNHEKPWYVTISGFEVYRAALWCEAANWVREQYVAGALPKHQPYKVQVLRQHTNLDDLLDKPFNELTSWEWQTVKKNYSGYDEDIGSAA